MPHFLVKNKVHVSALLSLAGLFVMISALQSSIRVAIDGVIMEYVKSVQTTDGLVVMKVITDVCSPEMIIVFTAVLVCLCLYKKHYYKTVVLTLVIAAGALSQWWLKNTLQDIRPEHSFFIESSFSFPSGHATMVMIFFLLVGLFFVSPVRSVVIRWGMFITCGLVVLAVGLSRIYLEVHWPSDVLGGYLLGVFWVSTGLMVVKNNFIFSQK